MEVPTAGGLSSGGPVPQSLRGGFSRTVLALSDENGIDRPGVGVVEVIRDRETGEVHALRGPRLASVRLHAESVLTRDGLRIGDGLLAHATTG